MTKQIVGIVVIGASAGGLAAIKRIVSTLPVGLKVAVVYVQHQSRGVPSTLPQILSRRTRLNVVAAADGQRVEAGTIYVAPPDTDIEIWPGGRIRLFPGCSEMSCPSIDRAIKSVAESFGERACAVLLTGMLDDGVEGLKRLYEVGGQAIVQHPADAAFPQMPIAALERDHPDFVVDLDRISPLLIELSGTGAPGVTSIG